ncbi:MAG TPA: 3-deoxy-7-phosphoheptulonate synthase [Deltaproteobacteria bacterium]|nr:3-deoxy-7-phosphoheptulonate synthase [Deltaproteobacteria bacterium]HCP48256.1 3-deoxy-7-phosphoheptulonate synthase [Deltaproteobacteria bacterium]
MLIVLKESITADQIEEITERVRESGLTPGLVPGASRSAITVTGNTGVVVVPDIEELPGVLRVIRVTKPYRLATLEGTEGKHSVFQIGEAQVGSSNAWFVAGPCSVDEPERLMRTAHKLKEIGAQALRGGAFKPRTNPYAFQGHGEDGLKLLAEARNQTKLPIVTEAMDPSQLDLVEKYADVVQIGARNMQNYSLLKRAGQARIPVLLKRGLSATLDELLNAAEYILAEGNDQVILCERGVRTFGDHCRFMLDVAAIPVLKSLTHLPVIVDPSHPAGTRRLVDPLARAAVAAGADGLIVEVHPEPEHALSDAQQALRFNDVIQLADTARQIASVLNRSFGADASQG